MPALGLRRYALRRASFWRTSAEWMEVYRSFDDGLGAAWSLGDLDTRGFVAELAKRMPLTEVEILAHLSRTDLFDFYPFTYEFFRARHSLQAIVTLNPSFFSEVIVPGCTRDEVTDTIVVSGEEKTIDKGGLFPDEKEVGRFAEWCQGMWGFRRGIRLRTPACSREPHFPSLVDIMQVQCCKMGF